MITLKPNEKVILIKRKYLPVLYIEALPLVIILICLIGGIIFTLFSVSSKAPDFFVEFSLFFAEVNFKYLISFILSLIFFVCWQFFFIAFIYYYLDSLIITDQRIIQTELISFFNVSESSIPHDQIQDVSIDIYGFLPTILQYGNLNIQTAGTFRKFTFQQIHKPYETKKALFQARDKLMTERQKNN